MAEELKGDPVDVHVGSRIKMQRRIMDLSQTDLGDAVGVTFQQVQKYENGKNRVSSSRLQQIAAVLNVAAPFFFEGLPTTGTKRTRNKEPDHLIELANTFAGLGLAKAFNRISDPNLRRTIVHLVAEIAENEDD